MDQFKLLVISARKKRKKEYLTNAKVFPPAVTTALKAVIRLGEEVEASLPTALQTYVCLFTAHVDQTL